MRRRGLLRGVIVALLTAVIAIPCAVQPAAASAAPAARTPVETQVDPATVMTIVKGLYDLWRSFKSGGMTVEQATAQILAAVNSAKVEIIAHMDRLAAAEARACATRHVIELADINQFNPTTMQLWAQDATGCVTLIDSLLSTVVDKAAADSLGVSLDVVGPIALIARSRAGFSTTGLTAVLINGNNTVINKIMPYCVWRSGFQPPYISGGICVAYNGDRAESPGFVTDALRLQAMQRTSWVVAKHALPLLQA